MEGDEGSRLKDGEHILPAGPQGLLEALTADTSQLMRAHDGELIPLPANTAAPPPPCLPAGV